MFLSQLGGADDNAYGVGLEFFLGRTGTFGTKYELQKRQTIKGIPQAAGNSPTSPHPATPLRTP